MVCCQSGRFFFICFGYIVQLAEPSAHNRQVAGSSPAVSTFCRLNSTGRVLALQASG